MRVTRVPHSVEHWRVGLLVALLGLLTPWGGAWAQDSPPVTEARRPPAPVLRLQVVVHEGRLAVDVQDAPIEEVLARIGQQAGIPLVGWPAPGTRVSAQFANVALDDGLRRVLQLAGLSYAILYAQGPSRTIRAVRVLGTVGLEAAPSHSDIARAPTESGDAEEQRTVAAVLEEAQHHDGGEAIAIVHTLQALLAWRTAHRDSAESPAAEPEVGTMDHEVPEVHRGSLRAEDAGSKRP